MHSMFLSSLYLLHVQSVGLTNVEQKCGGIFDNSSDVGLRLSRWRAGQSWLVAGGWMWKIFSSPK